MELRSRRKSASEGKPAGALVELRRSRPAAEHPAATGAAGARLYVETYGCQMNVADSDMLTGLLGGSGYQQVPAPDQADVIVINTCAVRERAEERVFARAQELAAHKRRRRGVVLAVVGCMAEHLKEGLLERAPHVDVVAGPDSYRRMPQLLARARARRRAARGRQARPRRDLRGALGRRGR